MSKSVQEIMTMIKDNNIEMVDFKMVDINGQYRHVTIPAENFSEDTGYFIFAIEENVHVGYEELMKCIKETADVFVKDFDEACEVFFG